IILLPSTIAGVAAPATTRPSAPTIPAVRHATETRSPATAALRPASATPSATSSRPNAALCRIQRADVTSGVGARRCTYADSATWAANIDVKPAITAATPNPPTRAGTRAPVRSAREISDAPNAANAGAPTANNAPSATVDP